jgi:hypothetical protein
VRFRGDEDDDVRLLAEVTVPELVAAQLWRSSASGENRPLAGPAGLPRH